MLLLELSNQGQYYSSGLHLSVLSLVGGSATFGNIAQKWVAEGVKILLRSVSFQFFLLAPCCTLLSPCLALSIGVQQLI